MTSAINFLPTETCKLQQLDALSPDAQCLGIGVQQHIGVE